MLGPFGLGYLYVADQHRDGQAIEHNWILRADSEDFSRLIDYRDELQPGARRFDVGQRTNFELTPMAIAGLQQLLEWGIEQIAINLRQRTDQMAARARELGLAPLPDDQRGPHLLGIDLPEATRPRVLKALAEQGCHAAIRGSALRIAPHLHVTDRDIDRFMTALEDAIAD